MKCSGDFLPISSEIDLMASCMVSMVDINATAKLVTELIPLLHSIFPARTARNCGNCLPMNVFLQQ